MAVRFDDVRRRLSCSARDLVESAPRSGDFAPLLAMDPLRRADLGRRAHRLWQERQGQEDPRYRAEVRLARQIEVAGWTCEVSGRVDGLLEAGDPAVVEEVKTTALPGPRLLSTGLGDWASYADQLRVYLWVVSEDHPGAVGRLVLLSVLDGSRQVLGLPPCSPEEDTRWRQRLTRWVEERERKLAWLAARHGRVLPDPFPTWRPVQRPMLEAAEEALEAGQPLLLEAPTGSGKTAALLTAALRFARRTDRQVFWGHARGTHLAPLLAASERLERAGAALRTFGLSARERACLHRRVRCDPQECGFARGYYDRVGPFLGAPTDGTWGLTSLRALGEQQGLCPHELTLDAAETGDVLAADYNFLLDPQASLRRLVGAEPARWVVVLDEVHQLLERARSWRSPNLGLEDLRRLAELLGARAELRPQREIVEELAGWVQRAVGEGGGKERLLDEGLPWVDGLAERAAELALDHARWTWEAPLVPDGELDPWVALCFRLYRLRDALVEGRPTEGSEALLTFTEGGARVGVTCLDPAPWLAPQLARYGGLIGASATLRPLTVYRDLLGLPESTRLLSLPSPFPPEHRLVLRATRVSTAFRDRAAHAARTASLLQELILAVPGNVAVYFSSFAMLEDLCARLQLDDRELLCQTPRLSADERERMLTRLASGAPPVVLAAVLGGIFAEGVDLPAGALRAVLVVGPGLPPVGLERELLKARYEERFGRGFTLAFWVPGLTRVTQAAGRLLRRPEDRGAIILVDRRFRWREVAALLPEAWEVHDPADPVAAVRTFFAQEDRP